MPPVQGSAGGLSNPVGFISDAAVPATVGVMRLATGAKRIVAWRDAGNTFDQRVMEIDAGGSVYLGIGSAFGQADEAPGLNLYATTTVALGIGATTLLYLVGTNVEHARPSLGSGTYTSPWGAVNGLAVQAVADANQVLAAAIYSRASQRFTGAITANRTMTYPLPASNDETYFKEIDNQCTGAFSLIFSVGAGTTVTVANTAINGTKTRLRFGIDGVVRVQTDIIVL